MTALHSTVPAVAAAIAALIDAELGPEVQVSDGRPPTGELRPECVYVADADGRDTVPVHKSGRKEREEDYQLAVIVSVHLDQGTVAQAKARAFELLAAVEDVLADDPSLGDVDGLIHATAGRWHSETGWAQGPVCVIGLEVDCLARIE